MCRGFHCAAWCTKHVGGNRSHDCAVVKRLQICIMSFHADTVNIAFLQNDGVDLAMFRHVHRASWYLLRINEFSVH